MSAVPQTYSAIAAADADLVEADVEDILKQACGDWRLEGRRVLLIVPDGTRTAPVGLVFKALHRRLGPVVKSLDLIIALGTHRPMTEEDICRRLEITPEERRNHYASVGMFNHEWDNPDMLTRIGSLSAEEIAALTDDRFSQEVPVAINRRVLDYDALLIVGPVFPHEVVGFSGGNKYFFPGVAGPEILNFFHWLGAVVTNPRTIGNAMTPVRRIVDRAAELIPVEKFCLSLVVGPSQRFVGFFAGSPESAWQAAVEVSRRINIEYHDRPFQTVLSCMPGMYEDLWTAGKGMYKLEPVVADGGEVIIYAPHISQISLTHGHILREIGYHCRDYFVKQWGRFQHYPWGVLAHSTHVRGIGTFEDGVETPRIRVTLATGIPPEVCAAINLGYRDPQSIRPEAFANRKSEGVLLVRKAGEMLHQLRAPADWARE